MSNFEAESVGVFEDGGEGAQSQDEGPGQERVCTTSSLFREVCVNAAPGVAVGDGQLLSRRLDVDDERLEDEEDNGGDDRAGGGSLAVIPLMDSMYRSLEGLASEFPLAQRRAIQEGLHKSHPGVALNTSAMAAIATAAAQDGGGTMPAWGAALLLAVTASQVPAALWHVAL
jgi:hypothetical protein